MTRYIQNPNGRMAGSIGDGRDNVPSAASQLRALADRVEAGEDVPGLASALAVLRGEATVDEEPESLFAHCETCERLVPITASEAARIRGGFRFDCDQCTDPSMAGFYGLWTCQECNQTGAECACASGPRYCTAAGCANSRGSLDDDGCCDFCDAVAVEVADFPAGSYHVCEDHADEDPDEDDEEVVYAVVAGRRLGDFLDAAEGGDCICPGECPRDPYCCTEGCAYCGTVPRPSDEQTWSARCDECRSLVDVRELKGSDDGRLLCRVCDGRVEACAGCGDRFPADELTGVMGQMWCEECYAQLRDSGWRSDNDLADENDGIGSCDHCDATYDTSSREDHCAECGTCWEHCPEGHAPDDEDSAEEDTAIHCDDCGAYLGFGHPEATWTCRACRVAEEAADQLRTEGLSYDQRHALRLHLERLLEDDADADQRTTNDRKAMLALLGTETPYCPFHDGGETGGSCTCPTTSGGAEFLDTPAPAPAKRTTGRPEGDWMSHGDGCPALADSSAGCTCGHVAKLIGQSMAWGNE